MEKVAKAVRKGVTVAAAAWGALVGLVVAIEVVEVLEGVVKGVDWRVCRSHHLLWQRNRSSKLLVTCSRKKGKCSFHHRR